MNTKQAYLERIDGAATLEDLQAIVDEATEDPRVDEALHGFLVTCAYERAGELKEAQAKEENRAAGWV